MSIPKVIYYCWFGKGKMPSLAEKCIASWKKFCPEYEIKRWDESNFDINEFEPKLFKVKIDNSPLRKTPVDFGMKCNIKLINNY